MDKKEKELVKSIKKNLSNLGKCLNYLDNGQVGYDDESMEETFDRLSPEMSMCFKKIRKDLNTLLSSKEEELGE